MRDEIDRIVRAVLPPKESMQRALAGNMIDDAEARLRVALEPLVRDRDHLRGALAVARRFLEAARKSRSGYRDDLDRLASAVYPHEQNGFTYCVDFMVEEIANLRRERDEVRTDAVKRFIDLHQQQCEGCGHFLIDVTASGDLHVDSHSVDSFSEGDLPVCARCMVAEPKERP
jgi:hypothetical protein